MNPGGGACSEPTSGHCTPAWATARDSILKKKKKGDPTATAHRAPLVKNVLCHYQKFQGRPRALQDRKHLGNGEPLAFSGHPPLWKWVHPGHTGSSLFFARTEVPYWDGP